VQFPQGVSEDGLRFAETLHVAFRARKIEQVPVFLFLDDLHQAASGELDIEVVWLFPRKNAGGLEVIRAQIAHIPQQRNACGMFFAAREHKRAITEDDFPSDRDAFRPHGHRGVGRKCP
jgi:hypothetical protein